MENQSKFIPINNWPEEDRPREKLLKDGEHNLSDSELLAIILGTGSKGASAMDLSRKILREFKTFRQIGRADTAQWKVFKGLGGAKLARIRSAVEIGRRYNEEKIKENRRKISAAKDVAGMLMPRMQDLKREVFKTVLLNSENIVLDVIETEEGTVNQADPIIREILRKALERSASAMICVHNHPSGNPAPSPEDKEFTKTLILAGKILLVECLDHIIIGGGKYFSFCDEGLL